MIAIYARRDDDEARAIRAALRREKLPAILVGPESGFCDVCGRLPFVLFTESGRRVGVGFARRLMPRQLLTCPPDVSLPALVRTQLLTRYSIDMEHLVCGSVRLRGEEILFRGYPLKLTGNEMRIVRQLAVCRDTYFSGEELAGLCLDGGGADAAAVHVCHLNQKSDALCGAPMIECRRFRGYRIPSLLR